MGARSDYGRRMVLRLAPCLLVVCVACSDTPHASDSTSDSATATSADVPDTGSDIGSDTGPDAYSSDVGETVTPPPIDLAVVPADGAVVAGTASKVADLVGGPKAEGQLGDLVLANHQARFLIEAVRPAGGYRQFGGNMVDADLQPGGQDRLGELWFAWNLRAFKPAAVEVVSDGRDGLAVVRATGRLDRYAWADAIRPLSGE